MNIFVTWQAVWLCVRTKEPRVEFFSPSPVWDTLCEVVFITSEHLLYDKSQSQCAYEMNLGKVHVGFFFDQIFDALNSTSSMGPGGFALLVEDASVDSWCREIYVPLAWRVYLTTGFDFPEKKNRAGFGSIGARLCRQPSTLPLYNEKKVKKTIFPHNFVYVLRITTTRHKVSLIDFYPRFLANFQT